jgi:hypothetical protein
MPDEFKPQPHLSRTEPVGAFPSMPTDFGKVPNPAAPFGNILHASEAFGTLPHSAEACGTMPKVAESFRTVPHSAESLPPSDWRESYTLTVRETARLFETAGVARSERSIVNWCQRNRQGIARLDAYYDPNERRYFITRQSADTLIAEEKARAAKNNAEPVPQPAEDFGITAKSDAETFRKTPNIADQTNFRPTPDSDELAELRKENLDLKITNRGKDYFIEQLQQEREGLIKQVVDSSQRVGQLEAKLLQLKEASPQAPRPQ